MGGRGRIIVARLGGGWRATAQCRHGQTRCARFRGMAAPPLCTAEATIADVQAAHQREWGCWCALDNPRVKVFTDNATAPRAGSQAPAGRGANERSA